MVYNFIIDEKNANGPNQIQGLNFCLDFIDSYFNKEEVRIYDCNITDKNLTYIFVIGVSGYPSHDLKSVTKEKNPEWITSEETIEIPKSIVSKYHDGFKISFLFFTTDECDNPDSVEIFSDYLDFLKINQKHFYLSTANLLLDKNKKEYNSNINVNSNNILLSNVSKRLDTTAADYKFVSSRDKLFQCYNNMYKPHRLGIYTFFNKENLTDLVDLSFLEHTSFDYHHDYIFKEILGNDLKKNKEWHKIASKSIKNKISLKSNFEDINSDNKTGRQLYTSALHEVATKQNLYKHAFINIVTESQYVWKNVIHITEKSILPFFFYQIPIIIATAGHVQCMKDRYDLDFFDDIINHSYDSVEDNVLRFQKITKEILRLSKMQKEIQEFIIKNQKRFEKNKQIIKNIHKSNYNKDFWKSLTYIQ